MFSFKLSSNYWARTLLWVSACFFLLPIALLAYKALSGSDQHWQYIADSQIWPAFAGTVSLVLLVVFFSFLLGMLSAFLVSFCDFPGRRYFWIMFVAPLALPTYVMAFVFLTAFDVHSPGGLFMSQYFPRWGYFIRSLPVASLFLSLSFYPYFFLFLVTAFSSSGRRYVQLAQSNAMSFASIFSKVLLPLAKPWMLGAVLLVSLEVMADFGASFIFNLNTLSILVYKSWFGFFSFSSACKVALLLLIVSLVVIRLSQFKSEGQFTVKDMRKPVANLLTKKRHKYIAFSLALLISFFSFLLPVYLLCKWSFIAIQDYQMNDFWPVLRNSVGLALGASVIVTFLAFLFAYFKKRSHLLSFSFLKWSIGMCFSIPGVIMAAALFLLSQYLVDASISFLGFNLRFWSVFPFLLMLCGLVARFTAIGLSNTESIFERGSKSYHQLASTLDIPPIKRWRKILLPIYLPGILTAWFFVFVEVIKEIPITLITRPSGFNTLSVRIFELVSEGEWYRASIPSLVLIIIGSIAVYFSLVRERESC